MNLRSFSIFSGNLASVVLCGWLAGCEPVQQTSPDTADLLPTYAQITEPYNARLAEIDQLWSSAVVEIRWTDKDGANRFEQGDGPLIWRQPDDLALAIGKLGNTRYWLGCNGKQWWLFDLSDERLAYVASHDQTMLESPGDSPLPVRPDQLIYLLGIRPLPTDVQAQVIREDSLHRVTFAVDEAGLLRQRVWIDDRHRATRIALLDRQDHPLIDASLSRFARMELNARPPGAFPEVATRIAISLTEPKATVTLFLSDPTDGKRLNKVKDVQFDFDRLVTALKVDRVEHLDRPAAPSPTAP